MTRTGARAGACAILMAVSVSPSHAQPYELHIIPKPPFEQESNDVAYGINDAGVVVGNFHSMASIWYGFAYTLDSGFRLLDTTASGVSQAWCINNSGVIGGASAWPGGGCHRAVVADASLPFPPDRLTPILLDWLTGGGTAVVRGINDANVRVGYSNVAPVCSYPFGNAGTTARQYPCFATRWDGAQASAVPSLGGFASVATSVNASGDIVGFDMLAMADQNDFSMTRAFLVPNGATVASRLATLGGSSARAFWLSNSGEIYGFAEDNGGHLRAARWTTSSAVESLGTLPGYLDSAAFQSTQDGSLAVGTAAPGGSPGAGLTLYESEVLAYGGRAVLFAGGRVLSLNSLIAPAPGVTLRNAFGVNSHGWIVGNCDFNGERRGFVLVPHDPMVIASPKSIVVCAGTEASFSVSVLRNDAATLGYQWRKNGISIDVATNATANAPTLTLAHARPADIGSYDCVVSNVFASSHSAPADLSIVSCCAADVDDGSSTGTSDGGVDINDLLYFLDHYEAGC